MQSALKPSASAADEGAEWCAEWINDENL